MRSSQATRKAVTRESSASRRAATRVRPSSSRVTVEAPATTERISRKGASRPAVRRATARSFQAAKLIRGCSSSAMVRRGWGDTSARPSDRARAFCSSMAWRTAGIPPRRSCSATGICSGLSAARAALRWVVTGSGRRGRSRRGARSSRGRRSAPAPAPPAPLRSGRRVGSPLRSGRRAPSPLRSGRPDSGPRARTRSIGRAGTVAVDRPGPVFSATAGTTSGGRTGRARTGRTTFTRAGRTPRTSFVVAVVAWPATSGHQGHRDALDLVAARSDDLDPLDAAAVVLFDPGRLHTDDGDPLELEVGLGSQDVAHLGHRREESTVERALRLFGPRGAPGPGSVLATAGQLDIDPARHPTDHATADSGSLRTQ